MLLHENLDDEAMSSISNPFGLVQGVVITKFLLHLVDCYHQANIAFIHPNYTANFYAPSENVMDIIKSEKTSYPAAAFLQGHHNFDVLMVPFHVRQIDEWRGGEH